MSAKFLNVARAPELCPRSSRMWRGDQGYVPEVLQFGAGRQSYVRGVLECGEGRQSYVREVLECGEGARVMSVKFPVIAELATVMAPSATVKKIFFPYLTRSLS